jgi:hypothetical protein
MKRNRARLVVILAAGFFALALWFFWPTARVIPPPDSAESLPTAPVAPTVSQSDPLAPAAKTREEADALIKGEQIQRDESKKSYRSLWRTPIVFYGRVLDETNRPIEGAQVTYEGNTIDPTLTFESHFKSDVYSDANGLFKIGEIRGRDITFQLSHPSYYNSAKNSGGVSYAGDRNPNIPDKPEKAWVFRMYKKRIPAELVNSSGGGHGRMDGSPLNINLGQYGQIKAEGNWSRSQQWNGKPFDWEVRLSVPNGEILECTDEVSFEAPTDGYKPAITITMSKDDKNWKTDIRRSFYIKSGSVFGRIDASISTYHDLYLNVHFSINPTGSTNLESGNGARITAP